MNENVTDSGVLGSLAEMVKLTKDIFIDLSKIFIGLGGFIFILYCFIYHFIPNVNSFGAAILFISIFVSFSFVVSFGLIWGFYATYWMRALYYSVKEHAWRGVFSKIREKICSENFLSNPIKFSKLFISSIFDIIFNLSLTVQSFLLSILTVIILIGHWGNYDFTVLMRGFVCGGFFLTNIKLRRLSMYIDNDLSIVKNEKGVIVRNVNVVIAAIIVMIVSGNPYKIFTMTFVDLGIRVENRPIILSAENYKLIESVSSKSPYKVDGCKIEGENLYIVKNVDIIWHSIGDSAYIYLYNKIEKNGHHGKDGVVLALDNKGVSPINIVSDDENNKDLEQFYPCPGIASPRS